MIFFCWKLCWNWCCQSWTSVKKKRKQFWKISYTTKSSVFAKEKKTIPFFLKDLCQIYFVQKTKRTFLKTSCSKASVDCWLFWFTKRKRKARPSFTKFDLNGKTLLILFEAKFAYDQKQNREQVVFSFCQDNNVVVKDNKTFFVSQLSKINKPLAIAFGWKKKLLFLAWEVEKLQKKCEHQRFVTKSNGQFHFFVTPTHQVMIVITDFNVFEHLPKSDYLI